MTDPEFNCADCGEFDVEWMTACIAHKGVMTCRSCECPYCEEEEIDSTEGAAE